MPPSLHRNQHQLIDSDSSPLNRFPLGNGRYSPSRLFSSAGGLPPLPPKPSCREMSGAALPEGQFAPSHCKQAAASPLCAQAGGPRGALKHSPLLLLLRPALGQGLPAPGPACRRTRRNVGASPLHTEGRKKPPKACTAWLKIPDTSTVTPCCPCK